MTSKEAGYDSEWNDLRRRLLIFWIVFLSYVPGVLVLVLSARSLAPSLDDQAPQWIAGMWLGAFAVAGVYRSLFRCPRCRRRFFCSWWYSNPYARKCVHCRLRRWSGLVVQE